MFWIILSPLILLALVLFVLVVLVIAHVIASIIIIIEQLYNPNDYFLPLKDGERTRASRNFFWHFLLHPFDKRAKLRVVQEIIDRRG